MSCHSNHRRSDVRVRRVRAQDFRDFAQCRPRRHHIIHDDPLPRCRRVVRAERTAHVKPGCPPPHAPAARHACRTIEFRLIHARLLRQRAHHPHGCRTRKRPCNHLRVIDAALNPPCQRHRHRNRTPRAAAFVPPRGKCAEYPRPLLREMFAKLLSASAITPVLHSKNRVAPAISVDTKPHDSCKRRRQPRTRCA